MWISNFLLGRPGYELAFSINPNTVEVDAAQIVAENRVLSGRLRKWVFRTNVPTMTLQSDFFTVQDFYRMQSLLAVTDTMLSFRIRDGDMQTSLEICYPTGATALPIRENSALLLSQALVAAGFPSVITINGIWDNPAGTGTNYFTGGSYQDSSFIITPGTPLLVQQPHFVTYSFPGYLVSMKAIKGTFLGGQIDLGKVSGWQLDGV